ncbi:helix-turn-helix domain-containing protein [Pseudarthrobacter sp. AB1]|uniref:helix-turn-helix transcriptional regulator n=1 Tax=Pseudarthrobacter sp. AB1 TaxID=2138309 RepID=UPI00186BAF3E|nr:helix-turn-helix domain-containing protein [Pseudarthrobacter sp. AB1]MBE4718982.1 AsnC family transcriptional regulator [Pseudarthrobacter sp. AB1]
MATKDFDSGTPSGAAAETQWTFLTNHAHVLLTIARDPQIRMRDVATRVGVTERAAQKITADLVEAGYITRTRAGRRNSYTVATGRPFRHPVDAGHELDELLAVLVPESTSQP